MSGARPLVRPGTLLTCLGLANVALAGCLGDTTHLTIYARNFTDQNINLALEIRRVGGDLVYNQTFDVPPTGANDTLKLDNVKLKNGDYEFIARSGDATRREQRTAWEDNLSGWFVRVRPAEISFFFSTA